MSLSARPPPAERRAQRLSAASARRGLAFGERMEYTPATILVEARDVPQLKRDLEKLTHQTLEPGFWDDNQKAQVVLRRRSGVESKVTLVDKLDSELGDVEEYVELAAEENDEDALAARRGFDGKLLSEVSGVVNAVLLSFYKRTLRAHVKPCPSPDVGGAKRKRAKLQSGTVTVVQRTSSDLRLNPHLHIIALDGTFAEQPDGPPRFVQLPALTAMDVAEVLLTIRCRVLRLLARRGVIKTADEFELLPSDEAERDPVLAQLTATAVCGQAPAGPERRQRTPLRLVHGKGPIITGPLCVADTGFVAACRHGG